MVDYPIALITTLPRLHQSTNIKQDLLLGKSIIYPEWKQLWVSLLWSILVRKFSLTFRKNWNHLRLIHLAKNIKKSCHLARLPVDLRFICLSHSVWSLFYILVTFCNIALMLLFSLLSTSIVAHPTPVHRHAFPHCFLLLFLCLFHLMLIWRFLLLLLLLVKRQLKFGLC